MSICVLSLNQLLSYSRLAWAEMLSYEEEIKTSHV